jgi:type IV pilus secretin PilQ/predicted competence protein
MFATNNNQNRGSVSVTAVVGLLMLTLACATSPTASPVTPELVDVRVETEGDTTVVTLEGTAGAVAQSFQEEDPARIVVNLTGVAPGSTVGAVAVYDGTVDEVMVSEGTDATRIEIALGTIAGHELLPGEGNLAIRIMRQDMGSMGADDSISSGEVTDPWATVAEEPEWAAAEPSVPETDSDELATPTAEATPESTTPATTLTAVTATDQEEGVLLQLQADGMIADATHFVLADPLRLVVDLPGLSTQAPTRTEIGGALIERIRVGQHEAKVRVVVDAASGTESFGEPTLSGGANGMAVALGGASLPVMPSMALASEEQAEADAISESDPIAEIEPVEVSLEKVATEETEVAMTEESTETAGTDEDPWAEAPSEEAAEYSETEVAETSDADEFAATEESAIEIAETEEEVSFEPVPASQDDSMAMASDAQTVHGVQLDSSSSHDRVIIVTDGPADYSTLTADAETVIVQLRGAMIDEAATARITPAQPNVVSMVSAFDQPEMGTPEVRVVIQRASGVVPMVSQQGSLLVLEFAKEGGQAAPIPVLSQTAPEATLATAPVPAAIPTSGEAIELLAEGGLIEGKQYSGRRISLDFKDVDIDDVLRLVAEVSDLNVVAGDEVSGSVTIRLVDVPWDQALDVILLTKGLGFVRVGNVLRIAPRESLKAEEEARLQEKRAKEKLEDLVVKLQPVNYANVSEVSKMIKRLLTARGTVDVDKRTNTIILKDIAAVIDEATALIKAIDTQTPQVMIEAKIVEANLDFLREVGSTWAVGVQDRIDAFDPNSASRTSSTSPGALGSGDLVLHSVPGLGAGEAANNFVVSNPITQLATGAVNLGAFILDEKFDVDVQLAAAESFGEGKVISSPRIVTLDNRKASIEQGVSIPFQTFENGDAKLEFIDAVLRLDVTPHITADRSIIMEIEVQRNAPDDSVPTPTGSPAIAKNEAQTETLVKDGQTLVIGGIYVVRTADRESRVPYLHQVPVIGRAFKNIETRDIRQELLVFVTPRIVVNPELGS